MLQKVVVGGYRKNGISLAERIKKSGYMNSLPRLFLQKYSQFSTSCVVLIVYLLAWGLICLVESLGVWHQV